MKKFSSFIQGFDIHAEPVTLNFRGKDKYQSVIGGLISLITYILVFLFSYALIYKWLTHADPTI